MSLQKKNNYGERDFKNLESMRLEVTWVVTMNARKLLLVFAPHGHLVPHTPKKRLYTSRNRPPTKAIPTATAEIPNNNDIKPEQETNKS